jgi:23S rRNA pseudouridine955/2504/2580 synthase
LRCSFAGGFDVEVNQFLTIDDGDAQLFGLRRIEQHAFHVCSRALAGHDNSRSPHGMQGRNTKTCWKYGIDMSANRKWLSELFCGCLMPVIDLFRFDLHHSIVCVFAARNSSNIASSSGERNTLWVAGKSVQKTGIAVVLFCDGNVFSISFLNAATAQSWYDLRVTATSGNCATEATSGYRARRSRTANRRLLYFKMNGLSKESASLLEVGEEAVGQRIDNFLLKLAKGVPKSHIYRILRSGEVRVNKKRIDADYRLAEGDLVRVPPIRIAARTETTPTPARDFDLLFEDEALLVVNKPSGVAVHGGSGVSFGVIEQLRRARPQARMLELAHRLDRETSGLLIVAKKRAALTRLHDMFRDGVISKRYLALVKGRWTNPLQHVKLPLHKYLTSEGERRVSVSADGKEAHSIVRLLARWENFSLVEVELKTGRTHQIRVHLAHLGFPIAGDDKYGDFTLNRTLQKTGLKRMFLHAAKLTFKHPLLDERITLEAPLPEELGTFLQRLDRHEKKDHVAAV